HRAAFVDLSDVTDPDSICAAILRTLDVQPIAGMDPLEQATSVLNGQSVPSEMLLLLDNFEQLTNTKASVVSTLLTRVPHLKFLVTSRRRLHLEGEHEFLLSPLHT